MKATKSAASPETVVRISVDLPSAVLADYTEQAMARNITVETLLAERLRTCASFTAVRPLYLDDNQHRALEKILGNKAPTSDDLVSLVTRLATVSVADTTVPVQGHVLTRLKTRCFGMTLPEYLRQLTTRALESEAGLR